MAFYEEVAQELANFGFLDVILPFILFFTITFAIFSRTKVLGDNQQANSMIAFVFAFLGVAAVQILEVVSLLAAYFVVVAILGLMTSMILVISGANEYKHTWKITGGVLIGLFAIAAIFAFVQTGLFNWNQFYEQLFWPLLLIALIIGATVYAIRPRAKKSTGKKDKDKPVGPQRKPSHIIKGTDDSGKENTGTLWKPRRS